MLCDSLFLCGCSEREADLAELSAVLVLALEGRFNGVSIGEGCVGGVGGYAGEDAEEEKPVG